MSQNAKQLAGNKFSYTLYDVLGRITEVGQKPQTSGSMSQTVSRDADQLNTWLAGGGLNKEQITRTRYDLSYIDGDNSLGNLPVPVLVQRNLRNRVSYTLVYDAEPDPEVSGTHTAATFYTYDIHGNVDTLLQDYNTGIMKSTGNRFKKMVYDYDLISGKVNQVAYQPGFTDEFYHKYMYDAENRITDVYTSHDSLIWEKDARYSYYKHGPLARTILGQQQVQGIDYAYTLQGWLKGVNSSSLAATNDIGEDGLPAGSVINQVAKDVYGFNLNYFNGDYTSIGGFTPFATAPTSLPSSNTGQDLFNGNISSVAVNIPKLGSSAQLYGYRYDQLNRIVAMDAFTGLNTSENSWTPVSTENYKERISYDANGNILTYKRNGSDHTNNVAMDDLTYGYNYLLDNGQPVLRNGNKILLNNKLRHVKDAVNTTGGDDIKNQADDNYDYDEIGNLIKDTKEGITNITWNVYGKILQIEKGSTTITYTYDAAGNRISKTVNVSGIDKSTYYVRDATGNVMSVYGTDAGVNSGDLTQNEVHLYGSSRLGIFNIDRDVQNITTVNYLNNINTFTRGKKFFELSNHLGNVLVTISDRKVMMLPDNEGCTSGTANDILNVYARNNEPIYVARQEVNLLDGFDSKNDDDLTVYTDNLLGECAAIDPANPPTGSYYKADVISANDYYPFGMMMPGRKYSIANTNYRYGFNGKENDNDIVSGAQDYGMRIYDARLGRFLSVDPLTRAFAMLTPYQFASNRPVDGIDLDGNEYTAAQLTAILAKAKAALGTMVSDNATVLRGASNAIVNANTLGLTDALGSWGTDNLNDYSTDYDKKLYLWGRVVGDVASGLQGLAEVSGGSSAVGGGAAASATGVGAVAGLPTVIVGGVIAGHGAGTGFAAAVDLGQTINQLKQLGAFESGGSDASKNTTSDGTSSQANSAHGTPEATKSNTATSQTAKESTNPFLKKSKEQLLGDKSTFEEMIKNHKQKLEDFKRDPLGNSSQDWLKTASKDSPSPEVLLERAKGRIPALEKQIKKQEAELQKINDALKAKN